MHLNHRNDSYCICPDCNRERQARWRIEDKEAALYRKDRLERSEAKAQRQLERLALAPPAPSRPTKPRPAVVPAPAPPRAPTPAVRVVPRWDWKTDIRLAMGGALIGFGVTTLVYLIV